MADPKVDAENLMNAATGFAEQMLEKYGEFFPYGIAMNAGKEIVDVAAYDGEDQPGAQELIDLLMDAFRQSASEGVYIATALVYDAHVDLPDAGGPSDAIAIALDHKDNYSVIVMLPYKVTAGSVEYGEIFAKEGDGSVFGKTVG